MVAFLGFLGGVETTDGLLRFLAAPPAPMTVPEEDRALLLSPQSLGHIASRGEPRALEALLVMTAEGLGGVCLSAADTCRGGLWRCATICFSVSGLRDAW